MTPLSERMVALLDKSRDHSEKAAAIERRALDEGRDLTRDERRQVAYEVSKAAEIGRQARQLPLERTVTQLRDAEHDLVAALGDSA